MKLFLCKDDWDLDQVKETLGGKVSDYRDAWNQLQDGTLLEVQSLDGLALILTELAGIGWDNEGVSFSRRHHHAPDVWRLMPCHTGWFYASEEKPAEPAE